MRRSPVAGSGKGRKGRGWIVLILAAFASGLLTTAGALFWPAKTVPRADKASPFAQPGPLSPDDDGAAVDAVEEPGPKALLAIVVGDLGYDPARDAEWLDVPARITLSVLPFGPSSRTIAASAQDRGHCVILHVPMEPRSPVADGTEPFRLRVGMDRAEIAGRLARMAQEVPQAVGAMNHMGSAFTTDAASMEIFAEALRERGYFFVDGVTAAGSLGLEASGKTGVPAVRRDVFLDDDPDPGAMRRQWDRAVARAKEAGAAVLVCHGRRETRDALLGLLPGLREEGIRPVTVTELLEKRAPAALRAKEG